MVIKIKGGVNMDTNLFIELITIVSIAAVIVYAVIRSVDHWFIMNEDRQKIVYGCKEYKAMSLELTKEINDRIFSMTKEEEGGTDGEP